MNTTIEIIDNIAVLKFDTPDKDVNILNKATLESLELRLIEIAKTPGLKGLILTGKPNCFVAGADIEEIKAIFQIADSHPLRSIFWAQSIFNKIEALDIPSVALIEGICVGGGYELALACDYRLATPNPKTQIGLPEVKLGIFPGWGGTQRLPRVVGLRTAMDVILAGKTMNPEKAYRKGLIDGIAPLEETLAWTCAWLHKKIEKNERSPKPFLASGKSFLERNAIGRKLMFTIARRTLAKKTGIHYPSPALALQSIQNSARYSMRIGLEYEASLVLKALGTRTAQSLIHVYDLTQTAKQVRKKYPQEKTKVKNLGVVGAGLMGSGIAVAAAGKGIAVRMRDIADEFISRGLSLASKALGKAAKKRKMSRAEAAMAMNRITGTTGQTGLLNADMVIEAVAENPEIKDKVFAELEGLVSSTCVLATNTSSLSATEMAKKLKHPERFVGLHFFNPAYQMPLVEVVPTEFTSEATVARALDFVTQLGKTPVLVKDKPGFLVNRILLPYLTEALLMVQEGTDPIAMDRAMKAWGMPMGPMELIDQVGMEIAYHAANHLAGSYEHMNVPTILGKIREVGLQKFYKKPGKLDPTLLKLAESIRREEGTEPLSLPTTNIQSRLFDVIAKEAGKCLDEGIVSSPEELDLAMIFGTGFPPFRGGPMYYLENQA